MPDIEKRSGPLSGNSSIYSSNDSHSSHLDAPTSESFLRRTEEPESKKPWYRRWLKPSPRMISDAIIGLSDGLTVPFALTAGLAVLNDTRIVVLGGLAELIAGAISMGLGGFVGAKSEAYARILPPHTSVLTRRPRESYQAKVSETKHLIETSPSHISFLVGSVFKEYGLSASSFNPIIHVLQRSPAEMLNFLMRFHHQMAEPETSRPFVSAITIGLGYFFGGFVPLIPYFFVPRDQVMLALYWSIGVMAIALFTFGWVKTGVVTGWRGSANMIACAKGSIQMLIIGGAAAGAAIGLVRAITHGEGH